MKSAWHEKEGILEMAVIFAAFNKKDILQVQSSSLLLKTMKEMQEKRAKPKIKKSKK